MARSPKTPVTLPSSDTTSPVTEPAATREVSFSPEALQAVIAKATADAVAMATAALRKEMQEALGAKPAKAAKGPTMSIAGKSERSIQNELQTIKAFAKAGFKNNVPHETIMTFNRWVAKGFRPLEGSKSLRINNLRLFHKSQVRPITSDEKAATVEQQKAAIDRHTAKGKTATVHHLPQ